VDDVERWGARFIERESLWWRKPFRVDFSSVNLWVCWLSWMRKRSAVFKIPLSTWASHYLKEKDHQAIFYPGCRRSVQASEKLWEVLRRESAADTFSPRGRLLYEAMQERNDYLKRICKSGPTTKFIASNVGFFFQVVLANVWSFIPKSGDFFRWRDGKLWSSRAVNPGNSLKSHARGGVCSQRVFFLASAAQTRIHFHLVLIFSRSADCHHSVPVLLGIVGRFELSQ